jgi:DinB superfamily
MHLPRRLTHLLRSSCGQRAARRIGTWPRPMSTVRPWLVALEASAPDVVACWRVADQLRPLRRELRARVATGEAPRIFAQQEAVAEALAGALAATSEEQLRAPGGEGEWNVAEAFAHTTAARRWLAHAAAVAVRREWPAEEPVVRPGIPGPADASRELLLTYLEKSRRSMASSAEAIAGHELEPCPLDHPLVGHLRCGEWLLFVGVHDLMHLEQLNRPLGDE